MTLDELRNNLREILTLETGEVPDWRAVEKLAERTVARLNVEPEPCYPHDVVYRFLEDADARQKSSRYADTQRTRLLAWLDQS